MVTGQDVAVVMLTAVTVLWVEGLTEEEEEVELVHLVTDRVQEVC